MASSTGTDRESFLTAAKVAKGYGLFTFPMERKGTTWLLRMRHEKDICFHLGPILNCEHDLRLLLTATVHYRARHHSP